MSTNEPSSVASLPVFEVTTTGITQDQANKLAGAFEFPLQKLFFKDGVAALIDPANYLAVPLVPVADPEIVAAQQAATTNHFPATAIEVRGIDYAALGRLVPLAEEEALRLTAAAMEVAGLTPAQATPVVGHSVFKTVSTKPNGAPASMTTNLDTHVNYRFALGHFPLVGPGAQVQVSFDAQGNVTRLLHSTRTLKEGPAVSIVSAELVRARLAKFLPGAATIDLRLVYWSPPLRPGVYSSSNWDPKVIIPWYAVTITKHPVDPTTKQPQPRTSRVHLVPATDDPRFVPSVTVTASAPQPSLVEAHAAATGGSAPYTFLWAGSNPEASSAREDSVSYVPLARNLNGVVPAQSFERTENVLVTVFDSNGVPVQAGHSLRVTARPAPVPGSSVTFGCESPNDPGPSPTDGSYAPERVAWLQAMGAAGQGGGSQKFCWLADDSWPGDYIEPNPAGSLEPTPWVNGDADHLNWGINTTNIMLYNGDGWPTGFAEMYPGATLAEYNSTGGGYLSTPGSGTTVQIGNQNFAVNYNGSWGAPHPNDNLQWLAMYACQILEDDSSNPSPWLRWGPAFNGLHSLLGFETTASDAGVGFMADFPADILGITVPLLGTVYPAQTIVQGWLNSALANQMGTPAAMGPIFNVDILGITFGICDYGDFYWGKGTGVGPTIPQSQINGWWYIQGTDALQEFPCHS